MSEGLKSPTELHKAELEHLSQKFEETTDPAEQERIAKLAAEERSRAAKEALVAAQQEQAALQALREKLGITATETEHFDVSGGNEPTPVDIDLSPEIADAEKRMAQVLSLPEEKARIEAAEVKRKAKGAEFLAMQEQLRKAA